jgi:hypothetical protein
MPLNQDEALLEQLRLPDRSKKTRRPQTRYVQIQISDAVAGCLAAKCPQAIVWLYIHYRVWADDRPTVPLPNQTLAELGVSRNVKWRTVCLLEQAGLIRVERRGRKSPLVTLLGR